MKKDVPNDDGAGEHVHALGVVLFRVRRPSQISELAAVKFDKYFFD